jgi:hypothetical protein
MEMHASWPHNSPHLIVDVVAEVVDRAVSLLAVPNAAITLAGVAEGVGRNRLGVDNAQHRRVSSRSTLGAGESRAAADRNLRPPDGRTWTKGPARPRNSHRADEWSRSILSIRGQLRRQTAGLPQPDPASTTIGPAPCGPAEHRPSLSRNVIPNFARFKVTGVDCAWRRPGPTRPPFLAAAVAPIAPAAPSSALAP